MNSYVFHLCGIPPGCYRLGKLMIRNSAQEAVFTQDGNESDLIDPLLWGMGQSLYNKHYKIKCKWQMLQNHMNGSRMIKLYLAERIRKAA